MLHAMRIPTCLPLRSESVKMSQARKEERCKLSQNGPWLALRYVKELKACGVTDVVR